MQTLGDKDITHIPKYNQGEQRNNITADLGTATPQQAAVIGQRTAALEGNVNPLEMQKAALLYGLTNGNNSLDAQNALLLSGGKTRYDNTGDVGTMDLLTGLQKLNQIGTSAAVENTAQANQANAGANENNAQAGLATTRSKHIKDGKGDGSQATNKDMSQIRDDIRSNYNLEYPINTLNGQRPKQSPSFSDYEKSWLNKFNVPEKDYYRTGDGKATAQTTSPSVKLPSGIPEPSKRVAGRVYDTPKGKMAWTGTGWVKQ